jgi:uncharacterized Zn finger protein (UPF0148 family)
MTDQNLEELCQHCGQALSNFLHQMEEHNAEVVCPSCGKTQDKTGSPGETEKSTKSLSDTNQSSPAPGKKRSRSTARPRSPIKP